MPSSAVAYQLLKQFRTEVATLNAIPYDDAASLANLAGTVAAKPILRRMKKPFWQWLTKRFAPGDLLKQIALLDQLWERSYASPGVHHFVGQWAQAQSISLRRQILELSTPYDLVADGIKAISPVIPDWYWRLNLEAIETGISISDQLYHLEAIGFTYSRARTEALRRIGKLFGIKLHHNEVALWFEWLLGVTDHPWNEDGQQARLCLNRLWWAQAVKLQARFPRPEHLPAIVPPHQHDYRKHSVSWIGDRPNDRYYPNFETVCVDLEPCRAGIPIPGDSVELPRRLTGVIRSTDYFEDNNGFVVRAILGVACKER